MRMQMLAYTFAATVAASGALTQTVPPAAFMSDKDIASLVDKAKADRKGDAPVLVRQGEHTR